MQIEGTSAELSFYEAGHLCILPTIPMCHETFFAMGPLKTITEWSTNSTYEEKIKEANECQRLYNDILINLKKYF